MTVIYVEIGPVWRVFSACSKLCKLSGRGCVIPRRVVALSRRHGVYLGVPVGSYDTKIDLGTG